VSEFSGSERTVAGYLLTEVLERQPPDVRDLLLRTSMLERCQRPAGRCAHPRHRAKAILQRLEDHNAFVTALDATRSWFRYHHLFADLLRLDCGASRRRRSRRCTAPRPPGTNTRATSSKPSATTRQPVTGHRLRTCSWTTTSH
jgi:ATP/maltotriose-dependent transcriptional regulator MalT